MSGHSREGHIGHSHTADAEVSLDAEFSLDARAKIFIFFSIIIVGVSTPITSPRAFAVYFGATALMVAILKIPIGEFIKRVVIILPFVLFVAASAPFIKREAGDAMYPMFGGALQMSGSGLRALANAAAKGVLGVTSLTALSASTPFHEMLSGFRWFKVPSILISLAAFVFRYMYVLVDEAKRMWRARDSRGWRGRWLWQTRVVGDMIAALLLRSFERAERIYAAMLSRGYDGSLPMAELPAPRAADFIVSFILFAVIISARLLLL